MNLTIIVHYKNWLECLFQTIHKFLFVILLIFSSQVKAQDVNSNNAQLEKILLLKNDSAKVDSLAIFTRKLLKKKGVLINKEEADFILKCADSGLLLAKKVKYTLGEIKIYTALGILYKDLENISKSLQYHEKALQLSLLLNHKKSIGNSYLNIAVMYKLMANYTEAAKYYFSALKVYEEVKDTAGMATNYFNLGTLFQVQDKFNEAIDYYSKAKFYFSKINYIEGCCQCIF
jgi:tetratricopeptide (TPR) repeat protein